MIKNISGQKFNMLTVTDEFIRHGKLIKWKCICDCGSEVWVFASNLRRNHSKSCGCAKIQSFRERFTTHNMRKSPEYAIWCAMKNRCNNKKNKRFKDYGERGIKVCAEWDHSFSNFFEHMGNRPSPSHTIGRINNDEGYCPQNCRWETLDQQKGNTRRTRLITINGVTKPLFEWLEIYPINQTTVSARIKYGWDPADAVTRPVDRWKPYSK